MYEISTATLADVTDIIEIENACFEEGVADTTEAMIQRIKVNSDTFLVISHKDTIIGYMNGIASNSRYVQDGMFKHCVPNEVTAPYLVVLGLALSPYYQGKGISKLLLEAFEKVALAQKRQAISLTCMAHLITFYEQAGYHNEGEATSQHGGKTWYNLVKELIY